MYGGTLISDSTINSNPMVGSQPCTFAISTSNNSYLLGLVNESGAPITTVYGYSI